MPTTWTSRLTIVLVLVNLVGFFWLSYAIREQSQPGLSADLLALVWLLTLALTVWRGRERDRREGAAGQPLRAVVLRLASDPQVRIVAVILLLVFVFRSAGLERLPWGYAGLNIDAAYNSEVALRILDGRQHYAPVMPSAAYVRDVLTQYYLAAFYGLLGPRIEVLRLACNVLALLNCVFFFLILRGYTRSTVVVTAATALLGFSGTDTILALSGIEYVIVTPFLLGSFWLFLRAMQSGRFGDAALAGCVWGLGFSSHYPYLFLAVIIPIIGVVHLRAVRPWRGTFMRSAFVAVLPKLSYLIFNHEAYFQRFRDVARHDTAGQFLVADHFRASARHVMTLLFEAQPHFKTLLPDEPLIPLLAVPLLLIGAGRAVRHLRRPEHLFVLLVLGLTVAVNLGAFVMDYRFINSVAVFYMMLAMGLVSVEQLARNADRARLGLSLLAGLLLIRSVAVYFGYTPTEALMVHYGTAEVGLGRRLAALTGRGPAYVLAPDTTYRLRLLNLDNPEVDRPNALPRAELQREHTSEGETLVLKNVEAILTERMGDHAPVHFVISPQSPYEQAVRQYLTSLQGAEARTMDVLDPVSGKATPYQWITLANERRAPRLAQPPAVFAAASVEVGDDARGMLRLTTFADAEQTVVIEEREVPGRLEFDFSSARPYERDWSGEFALRWWGFVFVERSGDYEIEASFDDGCRVFLDGYQMLADWRGGATRTRRATARLDGGWHRIQVDYVQYAAVAYFALRLGRQGASPAPIPLEHLAARARGG